MGLLVVNNGLSTSERIFKDVFNSVKLILHADKEMLPADKAVCDSICRQQDSRGMVIKLIDMAYKEKFIANPYKDLYRHYLETVDDGSCVYLDRNTYDPGNIPMRLRYEFHLVVNNPGKLDLILAYIDYPSYNSVRLNAVVNGVSLINIAEHLGLEPGKIYCTTQKLLHKTNGYPSLAG